MTWLERPAAVYTRHEVVLHNIDAPMLVQAILDGSTVPATFEVWEARFVYVFDAGTATWSVAEHTLFGYRQASRRHAGPRREIPVTNPAVRELAQRYVPTWIPEPHKRRLELPAEDVWDECAAAADSADLRDSNPYRGE
jgi:hypothetical protein